MSREPFGDVEARRAGDLAMLLVTHARVALRSATEDFEATVYEAEVAIERMEHARRVQRHWRMRAERAIALVERAKDLEVKWELAE